MLRTLSVILGRICGEEQPKSTLRQWNTSVPALSTAWSMLLVLHWCCTPPPEQNTGGTLNLTDVQANRQSCIAIAVMAMNVLFILSIDDRSLLAKSEICFRKWTPHTNPSPHSPQIIRVAYVQCSTMLWSVQWCDGIVATSQNVFNHLT